MLISEMEYFMKITADTVIDEAVKVKNNFGKYSKKRILLSALAIFIAALFVFQCAAVAVAYRFALTPKGSKSFLYESEAELVLREEGELWLSAHCEEIVFESFDGLSLVSHYVKNENYSTSYAILLHQYSKSSADMIEYARHYYDLGFNLLLLDARAHGKSEGKSIGMGWFDRLDVMQCVDYILEKDSEARILIHGVSLGASAALCLSGEELPSNVRCIIADSAMSSAWDEFKYQAKEMFSLPAFPIVYMENMYVKLRAGWELSEASPLLQVIKSETPTLFIHGEEDTLVPISQCNRLYDACSAEKEQYIAKGASHAQALSADSEKYWAKVDRFLLRYFGL